MFWGISIENGKRYSQVVNDAFHVSMATLELHNETDALKKNPYVAIMIEKEKAEFLLCILKHGVLWQQALDLNFIEGEEVTFFINGEGVVHLTGYVLEENEDDSAAEYDDSHFEKKPELKRKRVGSDNLTGQGKKQRSSLDMDDDASTGDDSDDEDSDEDLFENDEELESSSDDENALNDTLRKDSDSSSEESDSEPVSKTKNGKKKPAFAGKLKTENATNLLKSPKNAVPAASTPKVAKKPQVGITPNQSSEKKVNDKESNLSAKPSPNADQSQSNVKTPKKRRSRKKRQSSELESSNKSEALDQSESGVKSAKKKRKRSVKNKTLQSDPESPNKSLAVEQPVKSSPKTGRKTLEGGVIIEDVHIGSGPEVKSGRMAHLYYVGKLQNNKEFDAVRKGETPFKFRLGQKEVISGWDIGIQGMRVGGKRRLIVPPNQGYGSAHVKPIPPNSTLYFDVDLVSVS